MADLEVVAVWTADDDNFRSPILNEHRMAAAWEKLVARGVFALPVSWTFQ